MCWSKLKAKVNEDGYIKPAIFETEWNRWYILMVFRGEMKMDEECLAEEKASDEPREEYIRLLEKEIKTCKAIITYSVLCSGYFNFIADIPNSYILADDLDYPFGNKLPLWLIGFLY